ncbi:MAG TPA: PKD domain-containing protein, partial [Candidatus Limnocylindrales bacterium]|nr:PKD domain-containing protein [Candidatus Limnocylindrales bacterium]
MANRVTQAPVEALETVTGAKARVTQAPVEVLETVTTAKARVSQALVEVLTPNHVTYTRTATDTTSVSDAATRVLSLHRSTTDTTTYNENVGRQLQRFLVDNTFTNEHVVGVAGTQFVHSTDTTSVSDAATRAAATFHRVAVDTVKAKDTLTYVPLVPVVSFTASVTSGTEPLRVQFIDTSTHTPTGWFWDFGDGTSSTDQNPLHVFGEGTYLVTLTASNESGGQVTVATTITVTAGIVAGPGRVLDPVDVRIEVDGVEITDDVRYSDAQFDSAVNGTIGQCKFAVRDTDHTRGFVLGTTIDLFIDDQLYWSGFIEKIHRSYSFDVDNTTDPETITRWFVIEGYDVNALLSKRVAWNKANPTKIMVPPAGMADATAPELWAAGSGSKATILYVLENYTVLSDDGVTFNEIVDIGSPNPDAAGNYGGGLTVLAFMQLVNSTLNGIFYLRPNRSFVFRDVEIATSPYVISDHPDSSKDVGPREYSATSDATKMVNDAMIWGTAVGANGIAFARKEDAASIDEHDR